jgi:acyl-CoA thioesterase YciA
MKYFTRKLIKPADLNARGTLFGGQLLKWIDGEAAIFAFCQANTQNLVTKAMSTIVSPVGEGDIIEFGCELIEFGNSSIKVKCEVRNKTTKKIVITVDEIVFVNVDRWGNVKKIDR